METPGFGFDGEEFSGGYADLGMGEFGEAEGFIYGNATEMVGLRMSGMTGSESSSSSSGPSASSRTEEPTMEQRRKTTSSLSGLSQENGDGGRQTASLKKVKVLSGAPLKVRKEKLGERITALQQLVSPYGKTDTASVLHEAMGYIKFLHEQVQVLSSPYLQRIPSVQRPEGEEPNYDLRSRGLCLVPVSCTVHVSNSNGADFWAPPAMSRNGSTFKG